MFVGVLPGIGALAAISLLLPVTFYLDPTAAIVMLAGVYYGSAYGGSTASILLNLPGTPSSAVACLDGYPMSKQGRAGVALFMTTIASFVGGSIGILIMMLFSPMIAAAALQFGAAEYFAMMLLGLVAASTISIGSPIKGIAMVVLGLCSACRHRREHGRGRASPSAFPS
jgi:putative tricarboxylic transport membrane protein